MKITDKDKAMFKQFHNNDAGKNLIDYMERFLSHVCDSRNWGEHDSKESTQRTAKLIQENIIDKIKLQSEKKEKPSNEYV